MASGTSTMKEYNMCLISYILWLLRCQQQYVYVTLASCASSMTACNMCVTYILWLWKCQQQHVDGALHVCLTSCYKFRLRHLNIHSLTTS